MNEAELMQRVCQIAEAVLSKLGTGWKEVVYQKAMEVALREEHIEYESQRVITISYKGYNVGDGQIDLLPFVRTVTGRMLIVVDLDATAGLKETDRTQVIKYIRELRHQIPDNDSVYPIGMKINFSKKGETAKIKDWLQELEGIQILECECPNGEET